MPNRSFSQDDKKQKGVQKNLSEANKDLKEARTDSAADYQKFKMAPETKLRNNQMQIATLKAKKSTDTKEVKERYDKRVITLEQKNDDLKMKINASTKVKTSEWALFKRDFNLHMQELALAIKDVDVDNKQ